MPTLFDNFLTAQNAVTRFHTTRGILKEDHGCSYILRLK